MRGKKVKELRKLLVAKLGAFSSNQWRRFKKEYKNRNNPGLPPVAITKKRRKK